MRYSCVLRCSTWYGLVRMLKARLGKIQIAERASYESRPLGVQIRLKLCLMSTVDFFEGKHTDSAYFSAISKQTTWKRLTPSVKLRPNALATLFKAQHCQNSLVVYKLVHRLNFLRDNQRQLVIFTWGYAGKVLQTEGSDGRHRRLGINQAKAACTHSCLRFLRALGRILSYYNSSTQPTTDDVTPFAIGLPSTVNRPTAK
ncbi:hypothetical protein CLF_112081 [Clonorchis sinensis]|uniref:Uncharacterized protein n=1 Tax=Clonorchis sinensis TaxID=79923 RepID=G7YVT5_CLOSI|nr:hypothetical protein CLF_112081 [Clonorchis sinensis]